MVRATILVSLSLLFSSCVHPGMMIHSHGPSSGGPHQAMPKESPESLIEEFSCFPEPCRGKAGDVYQFGAGPGVLLLHEVNGLTPETLTLAKKIGKKGYTVFVPLLFGKPGQKGWGALSIPLVCGRRDIFCRSKDRTSPIVDRIRALLPEVKARSTGRSTGNGIAIIGMCLTGSFPLVLMEDPAVKVVVLSQPSLPLPLTDALKPALGLDPEQIKVAQERSAGVRMLGFRFQDDRISPKEKFETLRELFGDRIQLTCFAPGERNNPHAVLTTWFVPEAYDQVIGALDAELKPR